MKETGDIGRRGHKRLGIFIFTPALIASHKRHKDWRLKPQENIPIIIALPIPNRPIILQWCKMLFLKSHGPKWPIRAQPTQRKNMAGRLSGWNSKVELSASFYEVFLPLGAATLASFQSRFSRLSNEWVRSRSRLWYSKSWRLRYTRRQWNILRAEVEGLAKVGFYKEVCFFKTCNRTDYTFYVIQNPQRPSSSSVSLDRWMSTSLPVD